MLFYVYMLKAINPGSKKTYVGYTNDVTARLNKHNSGKGAKSTKGYKWVLIYKKRFTDKNKAMSFEYELKNNRSERKKILDNIVS